MDLGSIAATFFATQAASRKCCPNRFRIGGFQGPVSGTLAPVVLFDVLDLFFAESKIVSDFVD